MNSITKLDQCKRAAILGGGVAGVSSAIALKQLGFHVDIYERSDAPETIGAGMVIWPNAAFVLEQLGVLQEIKAVSGCPGRMQRLSSKQEKLGAINIGKINSHMGYPSLSILRKDLQDILLSRLASLGATIQYGHTVTGIQTQDNQASVNFHNGKRIKADIIIGADGRMASTARQYANEDNTPIYQGFINWIGVFESEEDVFDEIAVYDYWGLGERFGIVPISGNKAYWAGAVASPEIGPRDSTEYKRELHERFCRWPGMVQRMIADTPIERINKIYVHDHNPMDTWHKNNLVVIGDAAHAPLPTSGQGACQALEDAWHLAQSLWDYRGDLHKVFTEFTGRRYEKTSGIIKAARSFAATLFNHDIEFCRIRNQNSRTTDYDKVALAMSRGWAQGLPIGP